MRTVLIYTWLYLICFCISIVKVSGNTRYKFQVKNTTHGLSNNTVLSIDQDHCGRLWFATYDGLTCYDGEGYHVIRPNSGVDNNGIPSGKAREIRVDGRGNIWVLFEKNRLVRLINFNGKCKEYRNWHTSSTAEATLLINEFGKAVVKVENKKYIYDPQKDLFEKVLSVDINTPSITLFNEAERLLQKNYSDVEISTMIKAPKSEDVWVGTLNHGLFLIKDGNDESIINFHAAGERGSKISSNEIYCVFIDNSGYVWAGTKDGGVVLGIPQTTMFTHYNFDNLISEKIPEVTVRAICKDRSGQVWLGTYNNGILIEKQDSFEHFSFTDHGKEDKWNWIRTIYCDQEGNMWVGSYAGLCRINPKTQEKIYYSPHDKQTSITEGRIYSIAEDRSGNLFIAEWGSLNFFERNTGRFLRIDTISELANKNIRKLMLDEHENLWVGTETSGVYVISTIDYTLKSHYYHDPKSKSALNSNSIFDIYQDNNGRIWIAGFAGLNSIRQKGKIEEYDWVNNNLPSNLIYRILESADGNIWCSTTKGIVCVNVNDHFVRLYDTYDGFALQDFSEGAGYMDMAGQMYFGGINGLCTFHPDVLSKSDYLPSPVLEAVTVNGTTSKELSLAFDSDSIVQYESWQDELFFDLKNVYINGAHKTSLAYKLVPKDSDFQFHRKNHFRARYFGLKPGKYTLVVKAANPDGRWSSEKEVYKFSIAKPFWMYTYFYLLIIVGLAGAVILFGRLRYIQMKKRNLELEALITKRTQKIEKQKRILESTNKRLEEQNRKVLAQRDQILAQRGHLLEMHHRVEEQNLIKEKFFTNISHDIRTPLSLICGPINHILACETLPDEIRPQLNRIQNNVDYIMQLLNQVLDKKKLELGGLQVVLTQGDIVRTCRRVSESFADQAIQTKILLQFNTNATSYQYRYDHEKLQQIVYNLLSNAIRFTNEGGQISCDLFFTDKYFEIVLTDTGIGIPEDRIDHIFDRYYQVGKSQTKELSGSGIGLSLVKDYVELLKGSIEVESQEGKGTQFRLKFPLMIKIQETAPTIISEIEENEDKEEEEEIVMVNKGADSGKERILIVEDNKQLQEYLSEILSVDYDVQVVTDGKAALHFLRKYPNVNLILSDWMMPHLDGIELCQALRKKARFRTLPFVLLTALQEPHNQKEGLTAGIDEYISKPFDPELLLIKISNLLKKSKQIKDEVKTEQNLKPEDKPELTMDDKLIVKIKEIVEQEIANSSFGQSELAVELGMNQMKLYRKLKDLVQLTPVEFIRSIRLSRASQLLKNKGFTINEVSYMVGFNDPKYFSRCFTKKHGMSPSKYRIRTEDDTI
ncbi:two-component regulator propeller domain-containing protein [Marinifilum sp.]|uniref:two-component regulator propeller domain-containing protein n=1 Tax=Marinifilum sp. TaxID=2033137 RepID=UPI003BAD33AB